MPLTLMYITNNTIVADIAQMAGVDRVWVDLEYIGKEERQAGMNTVKSHHTLEDVRKIRPLLTASQLMVRVNPIHKQSCEHLGSQTEIESAIEYGADVIMLPMFKTRKEVETFVRMVDGRAKTNLLVETPEAVDSIEDILAIGGIDEVHIGLNDLHLAYHKKFMFELLSDGTVEKLCNKIRAAGIKYGFGGIARVGYGMLPAEYVIAEHYAIGSTAAILSRSFCDANIADDPIAITSLFCEGVKNIRNKEREASKYTEAEFIENRKAIAERVQKIIKSV